MERDFSSKGVKFFYIYKSLAHPEINGYITPFTLEERLRHVKEAKAKLGTRFQWLCDTMENDAKHALGDAPNSEFVIDPTGKIVVSRQWSKPDQLREDLESFVGKVANPTTIADLDMAPLSPPKRAATGIVQRLEVPPRMMPVRVEPVLGGEEPFYVKLRVEAETDFFQQREGAVYLGFFLDPLYEVHWNNEAPALTFEISAPEGVHVDPLSAAGPKVEAKADADPREFLINVRGSSDQPLQLTVKYFACDDAETFCKPVTQKYSIVLERDRDGGSRRNPRGGGRPLADAGPPAGPREPGAEQRGEILKQAVGIFREYDVDQDGQLSAAEWANVEDKPRNLEVGDDQSVSLDELIEALAARARPADQRPGAPGRFAGGRPDPREMFRRLDADGDGKILRSEVPPQMAHRWDRMDQNGDGVLDQDEQAAVIARFRRE